MMAKFICQITIFVAFLGLALAEIDLNKLQPNEIANFQSNEALDKAKTLVKEKCIKNAGQEAGTKAYEDIEKGVMELGECAMSLANVTVIQEEIAEASPKGDLDTVFSKYCNKRPEAFKCFEDFNAKLAPCLDQDEKDSQSVMIGVVRGILNFVCHKDGDQIALFIAEQGPECLESKKDDIQKCFKTTFAHYMPKEGIENVQTLPKLIMEQEQCDDMENLQNCIVAKLENCKETTPANIVEALFRYVRKETKCKK